MGYAETVATIHAPVEAVWNCLNDIAHTKEWVTGLDNAELITAGVYGVGSRYYDYNRIGPFPQTTLWEVTDFEPMIFQVHVSDSAALPSAISFTLSSDTEGTQVRMAVEYRFLPRLGAFSRFLERLVMNRLIGTMISQNLANLDVYLGRRALQPA